MTIFRFIPLASPLALGLTLTTGHASAADTPPNEIAPAEAAPTAVATPAEAAPTTATTPTEAAPPPVAPTKADPPKAPATPAQPPQKREQSARQTHQTPKRWSSEDEGRVALRFNVGTSFRAHQSMDLYSSDNTLLTRGAGLGVDVWRFQRAFAVAIEGDYAYEKASSAGVLGGNIKAEYKQQQGNLGVSLRYDLRALHPALSIISAHLRAFGSVAGTKQLITDRELALKYDSGYQIDYGGGVAAGVALRSPALLPLRDSSALALSVGLRLELGYGFMGDPELRLDPTESGDHPIPVHGATLGSLELDAAFFRTSFELRL